MAESKRIIEFETRKRIFDLVGDEGTCKFCKIIPRKGPIYQSKEEDAIVCSSCKDSKKGKFRQNAVTKLLEKMLATLPRSCKFKKNGCKINMDIQSIEYHEEDCEQRDIECPEWCEEIIPASSLFVHLRTTHNALFHSFVGYENKGPKYIFNSSMREIEESDFEDGPKLMSYLQIRNKDIFAIQFLFNSEISMAKVFVQILGSKFEAKNYKYAIKFEEAEDPVFGDYNYKNQVKSLDDKKEEVFKSNACLILPLEMVRDYIDKKFKFIVEIEDLEP